MKHNMAYINPDAQLGANVKVDPFASIHEDVEIGEGCWIGSNAVIMPGTRMGKNCKIFPGAVVGAIPQDLKYKGEETTLILEDNVIVREYCTLNKGTTENIETRIRKNTLLMAYVHVAHDCDIGENCILANNVNLAGHIKIENYAILEGLVAVQQFVKIGTHSFVTGGSLVRKNVPPFVKAGREPLSYVGVNSIGLQRRGFDSETINYIKDIYRILYVRGYNTSQAVAMIKEQIPAIKERDNILDFIKDSPKGIMRGFRHINGKKIH